MIDVWFSLNTIIQSRGRSSRIHFHESPAAPPCGDNAMTSFPANGKILVLSETVHDRCVITIKNLYTFADSFKSLHSAPPSGDNATT